MHCNSLKYLLILFVFSACFNFDNYSDDALKSVGTTINGKKEGEWKTYFVTNRLSKIENYKNDTLNGSFTSFSENGNLYAKGTYKMGLKIDSFYLYNSNGTINLQEWRDSTGKSQGLFKVFYDNGQLSQLGYMKDSYLDDTSKSFFDNGQLKAIEFYQNIKKEGKWSYFDEEGKLLKVETYKNDLIQN